MQIHGSKLIPIIVANDEFRHTPLESVCANLGYQQLLEETQLLEKFRRFSPNLYERVRAELFLYAIYKFYLPSHKEFPRIGKIPAQSITLIEAKRYEEAIEVLLKYKETEGLNEGIASALALSYYRLAFQTLAEQVRKSVCSIHGNRWMFRIGHPLDYPILIRAELLKKESDGVYPILREQTPVRMDLTHCGWSDIFFLAMDFPEGARVLNISIDLGVYNRDPEPTPPVEAYFRIIDEPLIRLVSVDLGVWREIHELEDLFDFGRDSLGLLKAAIIASGLVPPGLEGTSYPLESLLNRLCGKGRGFELVTKVNDIPKGSRLAVSTTLLACAITVCMRASSQVRSLEGPLNEDERKIILARALLGEWLGGSGGGWQDSGGIWPGIKLISGVEAKKGDPEFGVSRGRLLPQHKILDETDVPIIARQRLQQSLVLVHGGMAQNVGPILEMVTEKYLLRCSQEWQARLQAIKLLDQILRALQTADIYTLAQATTQNFFGPIQTIIPWATNLYTESLIEQAKRYFKNDFWGFWMLGGMSGGGMGFIFSPERQIEAKEVMLEIMINTKRHLERMLPFAMDPVVYDFKINDKGSWSTLLTGEAAIMPPAYYTIIIPKLLKVEGRLISQSQRAEIARFAKICQSNPTWKGILPAVFDRLFPMATVAAHQQQKDTTLQTVLNQWGFDKEVHESIKQDLRTGKIGLAQNRLPASVKIEDVRIDELVNALDWFDKVSPSYPKEFKAIGEDVIRRGQIAIVTMAAGAGTRWTQGASVVKALNPFCKIAGKYRNFLEIHLAKTRKISQQYGTPLIHIITTSYLTDEPIRTWLKQNQSHYGEFPIVISPGKSIGLRLIPTEADLRLMWGIASEIPLEKLKGQKQAWLQWVREMGEAQDYIINEPVQCVSPVGHWYEIPNLLLNGVLADLLKKRPQLKYLLLHNIDSVGLNIDPSILGCHIKNNKALTFEVIPRRIEDRGGGVGKIFSKIRIIEALALPEKHLEFELSFYNTLTTWIDIDKLLTLFGLTRESLTDSEKVITSIRRLSSKIPTYITIKFIRYTCAKGQEEIHPVAQYEKLWGDITSLPEVDVQYVIVPRMRGAQLKDPSQLDGWFREGGVEYIESLGLWD